MRRHRRRNFRPDLEGLESLYLLSALTPAQFSQAYGINLLGTFQSNPSVKADGTGQTVAIVDAFHDPRLASDLATFSRSYGLPAANLSQFFSPGTGTNDGWAQEEALDVEWVHAVAPGAKIIVVEARSDSVTDLLAAVDLARFTPGVSVVSMSWGGSELSGQTAYDYHFTTPPGHTGITFIASTGDDSARAGASWPASSANVLAVGGTTLRIGFTSAYVGESAWSGGGGGLSQVVSEPAYQRSVQGTGVRSTPDVSINANPNTGYSVYFTSPTSGRGGWSQIGGTSAAAQVWAGLIAIVDQGRVASGLPTLDGATQTLLALYSLPAGDFHDVTTGSNGFSAHKGYDYATGLGTPVVQALVADLVRFGHPVTTTGGAGGTTTGPIPGPIATAPRPRALLIAAAPVLSVGSSTPTVIPPPVVPIAPTQSANSNGGGLGLSSSAGSPGNLTTILGSSVPSGPGVVPTPLTPPQPIGRILSPADMLIDPRLSRLSGPLELGVIEMMFEWFFPTELFE